MVFISYAREDISVAAKLVQVLTLEGVDCILDPELIEGDPFWRETIVRRFPECDLMVGLHSPFALASPWVEQEQHAFPGPKLWLAVDAGIDSKPPSEMTADIPIPFDQALSTIRAALPRRRRSVLSRQAPKPPRERADDAEQRGAIEA